jgi:hypothetical protein
LSIGNHPEAWLLICLKRKIFQTSG